MNKLSNKTIWPFLMLFVTLLFISVNSYAKDKDDNPPGAKGGPGTNWENPPGPAGGPGVSPDVKGHPPSYYNHIRFCKKHPWHKKCKDYHHSINVVPPTAKPCKDSDNNPPGVKGGPGTNWENPPGPKGGPGASPNHKPPKHK